jgi:hypothetical protein
MSLKQFDVKTAFPYGELEEEVYLEQLEGFDDGSGRVYQLMRSVYGLKHGAGTSGLLVSWRKLD